LYETNIVIFINVFTSLTLRRIGAKPSQKDLCLFSSNITLLRGLRRPPTWFTQHCIMTLPMQSIASESVRSIRLQTEEVTWKMRWVSYCRKYASHLYVRSLPLMWHLGDDCQRRNWIFERLYFELSS
jgi:hypothetical protein